MLTAKLQKMQLRFEQRIFLDQAVGQEQPCFAPDGEQRTEGADEVAQIVEVLARLHGQPAFADFCFER